MCKGRITMFVPQTYALILLKKKVVGLAFLILQKKEGRMFGYASQLHSFGRESGWKLCMVVTRERHCLRLTVNRKRRTYHPRPGMVSILYNMAGSPTVCSYPWSFHAEIQYKLSSSRIIGSNWLKYQNISVDTSKSSSKIIMNSASGYKLNVVVKLAL